MGKLQEFEISFDKNKSVYSPGESIDGTLKIKVSQSLQCKAIKVNCNGFCGVTNKVNDTSWMVEEQYFNSTVSVADKGTLKQGEHTFPFKFLIPASAPTSFEGSYGKIIYRVRASVDTPRFAKDYTTEKPFYLLSLLNLNEVADIWGPSSSAVTQQFTYMLMKTGTVVLKAQTDMKGYTPGQIIQVAATIHNQSEKKTGNVAASLMQRVTYETKKPTYDLRAIAEVEGGVVKANREIEWKEQIIVPPLPQSVLAGCDIIKIEYYVKVSLKYPEVMVALPIHIGNVALDKKLRKSTKSAPSASAPSDTDTTNLTPGPAPKPAPRVHPRPRESFHNSPSAPPIDYEQGAVGGPQVSDAVPNKRHSQFGASVPHVSPTAFSYAPGLFFANNQQHNSPVSESGRLFTSVSSPNPVPPPGTSVPPDYETAAYPTRGSAFLR
ncbi:arrestin domain-containing protein 1a [Thalassophryne amazonica]|uniref:arrestin domain-containing protein 1a n=1 Tax=Thalassophryne amazonica TaxID=390379 RepID=UPI00147131BE|nr:arrestin domain-containing protein 1a [Thalassophryne amazonica]